MAIIKCKMCGGDLDLIEGQSVAECEYCGSRQTVPTADNEKKLTLFARANRLRAACEFDKAAGIYESIVADFPEEAEAYWGLVLCKYGIEYVDDPATGKKIPTCHRSSFDSIMEDSDFEQAVENADVMARKVYREEAKQIEEIRKGIIAVSANEKPYDIFICYKETDANGDRTLDSVLAQDIYDVLTDKGYRVFFSRITLEDKLGQEYEPYIFAALNSAKIMLAVGTDYEYFNAVWVKNEWSRYLKLMVADKSKHLIPCFKGIDAYDMPKEFARLQAQDLGKVGAMQDLLRGVEKILPKEKPVVQTVVQKTVVQGAAGSVDSESLLKRAFMFLEDGNWSSANAYCEKVLDIDPENARAYLGKLMAELKVKKQEDLKHYGHPFDQYDNYKKIIRFGDAVLIEEVKSNVAYIRERNERERKKLEEIRSKLDIVRGTVACGAKYIVGRKLDDGVVFAGEDKNGLSSSADWHDIAAISAGPNHAVGLKSDGTVVAVGDDAFNQCKVTQWENVVAISAGYYHTVGLKADGTVLAVGKNSSGQCEVSDWKDIVAISAGDSVTVGLKADGTVLTTVKGYMRGYALLKILKDVVAVNIGSWDNIICLKANGTVWATNSYDPRLNEWRDIVAVSEGRYHSVGLQANGTVVAGGKNEYGQCDVADWTDIVAISAGDDYTVGLKANGTVVVAGKNKEDVSEAFSWKLFNSIDTLEEERHAAQRARRKRIDADAKNRERLGRIREKLKSVQGVVSAGNDHTVGLKADGTAVAVGDNDHGQCEVSDWTNIVAISAGRFHTVGLKADGTAVAVGDNDHGQCEVSDWTDIAAISAGPYHTVGLRLNGTVVATKYNGDHYLGECEVSEWTDIVAIGVSLNLTVGLRSDGTIIVAGYLDENERGISNWTNIVTISTGDGHIVGLRSDGTVLAVGGNDHGQCEVSDWTDIVAISAGDVHTVGLKSDGTVLATKYNGDYYYGQCDVSDWTDIVAISAGDYSTVGLRRDGTVVVTEDTEEYDEGDDEEYDEGDIVSWRLFDDFDNLGQERQQKRQELAFRKEQLRHKEEAKRKREQEDRKKQQVAWRASGKCQHCGGQLKGLFGKKCVNCGKPKDY